MLSLGEAKWVETVDIGHLRRLQRAAGLLAARDYDTRDTILACYSAAGFGPDLREQASRDPGRVCLIGPGDLYTR